MAGAPIINHKACVIAIAYGRYGNSSVDPSANVGLGIGATGLNPIVKELSAFGSIAHSYIGVSLDCEKTDNCLNGVFVSEVFDNSPAAKAGLKSDDKIISIDGLDAQSVRQITNYIRSKKPSELVTFIVERPRKNGDWERLTIKIPVAIKPKPETVP
jgi:serine protease Do